MEPYIIPAGDGYRERLMVPEYRQRRYYTKRVAIGCTNAGDHYELPDVQFPRCVTDAGYAQDNRGWMREGRGDNVILYTDAPPPASNPSLESYSFLPVVEVYGDYGHGWWEYYSNYKFYAPLVQTSFAVDASVWGKRQAHALVHESDPMLAAQGSLHWYNTESQASGAWSDPPIMFLTGEGVKVWGYGGWEYYEGAVLYGWYEYHEYYGWRSYSRESDTLPDDVLTNPARINPWCKAVYDITYYRDITYYTQYERISARGGIAPILGALLGLGAFALLGAGYVPPKKPGP